MPIDLAQEGQPLLMTIARGSVSEHLAGDSPRRRRGSPSHAGSSRGSGLRMCSGPKASRAGCVRGPGTGSFHHSRAPRPDQADPGRGPPRPEAFLQTERSWRADGPTKVAARSICSGHRAHAPRPRRVEPACAPLTDLGENLGLASTSRGVFEPFQAEGGCGVGIFLVDAE